MKPEISVIIPVYHIENRYLRECADSLIRQSLDSIEMIFVDDGSTSDNAACLDEIGKRDDRIRIIHQENQGVSVARNAGIEAAEGEYIMFVDADDYMPAEGCEIALNAIQKHGCDLVYLQKIVVNENGDETERDPEKEDFILTKEDLGRIRLSLVENVASVPGMPFNIRAPWAKIIRKSFLEQHQIRFQKGLRKAQDVIFNMYVTEYLDKAAFAGGYVYCYRIHEQSVCRRLNPQMPENILNLIRAAKAFIDRYHAGETPYRKALGMTCFHNLWTIEDTLTFHRESRLTRTEIAAVTKAYWENPMIRELTGALALKDFPSPMAKLKFFILQRGWYGLYITLMSRRLQQAGE